MHIKKATYKLKRNIAIVNVTLSKRIHGCFLLLKRGIVN